MSNEPQIDWLERLREWVNRDDVNSGLTQAITGTTESHKRILEAYDRIKGLLSACQEERFTLKRKVEELESNLSVYRGEISDLKQWQKEAMPVVNHAVEHYDIANPLFIAALRLQKEAE